MSKYQNTVSMLGALVIHMHNIIFLYIEYVRLYYHELEGSVVFTCSKQEVTVGNHGEH